MQERLISQITERSRNTANPAAGKTVNIRMKHFANITATAARVLNAFTPREPAH